jgi:hypothetical protein
LKTVWVRISQHDKGERTLQSVYLKGEELLLSFLFVRCIWLKEVRYIGSGYSGHWGILEQDKNA